MDPSLISGVITSINAIKEITKAGIAVRDFNLTAAEISKINGELLKSQDLLFKHNAELLTIQQELFEKDRRIRELEASMSDRDAYFLDQLVPNVWVYKSKTNPPHHLCQPCYDAGKKSILQSGFLPHRAPGYICQICKSTISLASRSAGL